jgi:hypothetical protein
MRPSLHGDWLAPEVAVMIWLFHRYGEYLSCEVRTCLENAGFELLIARSGRLHLEWYPDELQVERRWHSVNKELLREGWDEMFGPVPEEHHQPPRRRSQSRADSRS